LTNRSVIIIMSPRTPKQFQEIREEKRTLIMDVALQHFANEGYFKTTINHIARHAGISKGLMYNYFASKESLLDEIIKRSVLDVYAYFDINKDGYLTAEEFDFFVRRISLMFKENQPFWRLLFQLLMQNEVREQFLKSFLDSGSLIQAATDKKEGLFVSGIVKTITEYFLRKKDRKGMDYDPYLELNMFIISLKGFALTYIYMEKEDEIYYEKTINRIIELFK
jgi:AcrR family transcriptional regulator